MHRTRLEERSFAPRGNALPEVYQRHPLMNDSTFDRRAMSPAMREAQKAFKQTTVKKAIAEQETDQKAFFDNRERLKAERLARETVATVKKE